VGGVGSYPWGAGRGESNGSGTTKKGAKPWLGEGRALTARRQDCPDRSGAEQGHRGKVIREPETGPKLFNRKGARQGTEGGNVKRRSARKGQIFHLPAVSKRRSHRRKAHSPFLEGGGKKKNFPDLCGKKGAFPVNLQFCPKEITEKSFWAKEVAKRGGLWKPGEKWGFDGLTERRKNGLGGAGGLPGKGGGPA